MPHHYPRLTARFWTWWHPTTHPRHELRSDGSLVKLSLRDGQRRTVKTYAPDEEGWSSCVEVFWREGDHIYSRVITDGRDCDGQMSTDRTFRCHLDHLASERDPDDLKRWNDQMIGTPDWQEVKSSQRDYTAEAAGY